MEQQEQIQEIQKKIDSGEIDYTKLDKEKKKAIDDAVSAGILNLPGGTRFQGSLQEEAKKRLGEEAKEADTISGVKLPFIGRFGNERADYELVGDLVGSFTPYIMNRKAIARDLEKGVRGEKFTQPTGKDVFKLDKFSISSSKFAKGLARVIGRRFGAVGRLLPRMVATTEKASKGTLQFVRQMAPKRVGGGGGITDPAQSLLRTGATTELQSIGLGATGAATGSLAYDLANFSANLGSDAALDLNDIDDNTYNDMPQPARSLVDASAAFGNSVLFGVAGTAVGAAAARGGRGLMKRLLGVNNPETAKFAKTARERGMELSIAQVAQESGAGSLIKNFFKILGVTPFVGGAGRRIAQKQFTEFAKKTLTQTEEIAPVTIAEFLGSGGYNQMMKRYNEVNLLVNNEYEQLNRLVKAKGDFAIIPTTAIQKEYDDFLKKLGIEDINNQGVYKDLVQALSGKARGEMTGVPDELIEVFRTFAGRTEGKEFKRMTFSDYQNMRRGLNNLSRNKFVQENELLIRQVQSMKLAMDKAVSEVEKLTPNDAVFTSPAMKQIMQQKGLTEQGMKDLILGKVKPDGDGKRFGGYVQKLQGANDMFFRFRTTYEQALASRLRRAVNPQDQWLFTSAQVNRSQLQVTPQNMFQSIQKNVLDSDDVEVIKQFKTFIGANDITSPATQEYGKNFMKKMGSRKIFDAFMDSLSESGKQAITSKSFMEARDELKRLGLKEFQYFDDALKMGGEQTLSKKALQEIENLGKKTIEFSDRGVIKKKKNPNYIEDPFIREQAAQAITQSVKKLDFSKIDFLGKDFDFNTFAQKLGIGTPAREDALKEIIGKQAFDNLKEGTDILKAAATVNYTDPSTFLLRSAILGGGIVGGGLLLGGGMGLGMGIAVSLAVRQAGKIFADPQASSKLLGIFTEAERKAMMDPDRLGSFFAKQATIDNRKAGPQSTIMGGIIDPTEPLGKYYGTKRSRNIGILFNYLNDEVEDVEDVDPDKITLQDINNYFEKLDKVDDPQINVFTLPDRILESVAPDALVFKYASPTMREEMMESMKGFNNANAMVEEEDIQLEAPGPSPAPQVNVPQINKDQESPAIPEQQAPANLNAGANYSFLFPGDTTGQAIAQKGTQSG